MAKFKKIINPGEIDGNQVYCQITIEDGRLSISGVIGPTSRGNSRGAAGQIEDELERLSPSNGWTEALIKEFVKVWKKWHLNDMRPFCSHQAELGWREMAAETVTRYHYRLKTEVKKNIREAEKQAVKCLKTGEPFTPTKEQSRLANLPDTVTFDKELKEADPMLQEYEANGPQYKGDMYNRPITKHIRGHLSCKESEFGLLSKPCPVCGYRYGSSWIREELPEDVINFLKNLPESKKVLAWI